MEGLGDEVAQLQSISTGKRDPFVHPGMGIPIGHAGIESAPWVTSAYAATERRSFSMQSTPAHICRLMFIDFTAKPSRMNGKPSGMTPVGWVPATPNQKLIFVNSQSPEAVYRTSRSGPFHDTDTDPTSMPPASSGTVVTMQTFGSGHAGK